MRTYFGALLLTCATACTGQLAIADEAEQLGPDSGTVAIDTGANSPDAGTVALPDTRPANTPDAGHPDALPGQPEASSDGGAPSTIDARSTVPDGAGRDGGATPDGRADSAPRDAGPTPICESDASACTALQRADDAIRAQLTGRQFECVDGARMCGSVNQDGTGPFTYPLVCRDSIWRLAVVEYVPGMWIGLFECSRGCGFAPALCAP